MANYIKILKKFLFVNALPKDIFDQEISLERARDLFSTFVDLVEIENHSFCNRTCWFCPNVFIDRRSETQLLSDNIYNKILKNLQSIGYNQTLVWSRYHEALAHPSIWANLEKARQALPDALLCVTSNTDYLNAEVIWKLESVGLDRLLLDLYLPEGKENDSATEDAFVARFEKKTGLTAVKSGHRDYIFTGSSISINMGVPFFTQENISTRAGLLDIPKLYNYRRRAICLAPVRHVVVDYNGKAMLCCQTRSDSPQHQEAIIGDLSTPDYDLFTYYRDLAPLRRVLASAGEKRGCCLSCDMSAEGPKWIVRNKFFSKLLSQSNFFEKRWKKLKTRRYEN